MSDTPQSERGDAQRDDSAAEQGRTAMQAALQFPMIQAVNAQKGAAELFLNGLEIGNWANRRSLEMTREAMENYLRTLDQTAARTERVAEENAEMFQGAARTGQEIGEESVDRLAEGMEEGTEQSRGQFHSTVERFPPVAAEQSSQPSARPSVSQGTPPQDGQPTRPQGSMTGQGQQAATPQDQHTAPSQGQQAPAIHGQQAAPGQGRPAPSVQSRQGTTARRGSQPPRQPPARNEPVKAAPPQAPTFQPPAGRPAAEYGSPEQGQPPVTSDQRAPTAEGPAPGGQPSPGPNAR